MDDLKIYRKDYKIGLILEEWWGGPVEAPMVSLENVSRKAFKPRLSDTEYSDVDHLATALHGYFTETYDYDEVRSNLKMVWGVDLKEVVETNKPKEDWTDALTEGVRFEIEVNLVPIEYDDDTKKLLVKLANTGELTLDEGLELAKLKGITKISELKSFIESFRKKHN